MILLVIIVIAALIIFGSKLLFAGFHMPAAKQPSGTSPPIEEHSWSFKSIIHEDVQDSIDALKPIRDELALKKLVDDFNTLTDSGDIYKHSPEIIITDIETYIEGLRDSETISNVEQELEKIKTSHEPVNVFIIKIVNILNAYISSPYKNYKHIGGDTDV